MEAVRKAADSIRNSPLFRRKFGTRSAGATPTSSPSLSRHQAGVTISPEKDTTPFVQGVYFHVDYLGKKSVDSFEAQDHGCTDEAVELLWNSSPDSPVAKRVSIKITTTSLRIKEVLASREKEGQLNEEEGVPSEGSTVFYEFPLFRVSYCGTNQAIPEAFSFVAKDSDGKFYSYVFRCATKDKSYALALAVAKAFYLAYQILLEQQGNFPPGPERELLFEPQRPDDTHDLPQRPIIQPDNIQRNVLDASDGLPGSAPETPPSSSVPSLRLLRPSQTSADSDTLTMASADEDFARLAKARSNPDILRSTLDTEDIKGGHLGWTETLRLHADPGSRVATPSGSTEHLHHNGDST